MISLNMSGDPNQHQPPRPNVFGGQDLNYPSPPNAYWNRFTNSANYYSPPNFPFASNYGNGPVHFPIQQSPQPVQSLQLMQPMQQTMAAAPTLYPGGFNPVGSNFGLGMTATAPPSYSSAGGVCSSSTTFSYTSSPIASTSNMVPQKQFVPCGMKRRTLSPPPQRAKRLITEEKMAEHMSQLSLHHTESRPRRDSSDDEDTPRLYISEEVRKLKTDSILPPALLDRIQRPCTAIVLWQPPPQLEILNLNNNNINDAVENNNNEEVTDNNLMELDR